MPKQTLEFTSLLSAGAVADYLEELAKALREGHISLEAGGEHLDMEVAPEVTLDLEAKGDGDKSKFALDMRLDWRLPKRQPAATQSLSIRTAASPPTQEAAEGEFAADSANLE